MDFEEDRSLLTDTKLDKRGLYQIDPLIDTFLSLVFYVPYLIAYFVPLGVCASTECNAESSGSVSISSLIEDLPYATVISTMVSSSGVIFCIFQIQHSQGGFKHIVSILGFFCVLVPLMLPLNETGISDEYHNTFAFLAFILEMLYVFMVFVDVMLAPPEFKFHPWAVPVVTFCFVLAVAAASSGIIGLIMFALDYTSNTFYIYFEILVEYLVLTSLLILITAIRELNIYPLPTIYDGIWPASFQPPLNEFSSQESHHRVH